MPCVQYRVHPTPPQAVVEQHTIKYNDIYLYIIYIYYTYTYMELYMYIYV